MQISIGWTGKRINSTSHTFTTIYENVDVKLKEPTSITRPQFLLKLKGPADIHKCNYLHYTKWGYYWIDDIIVETNDLVTLICRRDVLASFKTEIGSTYSYVNYTTTIDQYNGSFEQDDPRLSPDILYNSDFIKPFADIGLFDLNGCVIVQTLAFTDSESGGDAGVNTYLMPYSAFKSIARSCADEMLGKTTDDLTRLLLGSDIKSNILSARYVPFSFTQIKAWYPNNVTTNICLAGFSVTVSEAVVFTSQNVIRNFQYTGADLFNDALRNTYKFLRGSKYTSIQLIHPCGNLDLSSDDFILADSLTIKMSVDLTCGDYSIGVWPSKGNSYPVVNGTFATDWTRYITNMNNPNTIVKTKALKAIGSLGAASIGAGGEWTLQAETPNRTFDIASSAKGESLARGVTGIGGAIENSYNTGRSYNNASSGGVTNTYAMFSIYSGVNDIIRIEYTTYVPHVMAQNYQTMTSYYASYAKKYGYPYFADAKINDLSGYVQCAGFCYLNYNTQPPTILRFATAVEIAEINSLLNSGIYYE